MVHLNGPIVQGIIISRTRNVNSIVYKLSISIGYREGGGGGEGGMILHDHGYLPPEFLRSYHVSE